MQGKKNNSDIIHNTASYLEPSRFLSSRVNTAETKGYGISYL